MNVQKILADPRVAHVLRMNARFGNRLGNQFAGAITYFSVLAMVPILMFGFAIAGMTLTEFRPDLLQGLKDSVTGLIQGAPGDVTERISGVIDDAMNNWRGIGAVGLLSLAYAGGGWIGNLKSAVRAQFRPAFDAPEDKSNIVVETLKNIGILVMLLLMVGVTFGIASLATSMTGLVIGWLGLDDVPGIGFLTRALSLVISLLTGWLLFLFLYRVLPQNKPRGKALLIGALIGSIALIVLQYLTGLLVGAFMNNPAFAIFGPVIVLMLFFNLFARLILMIAAWVATDNQPAIAHKWTEADKPLLDRADVVVADEMHWPAADADRREQEINKADAKLVRTEKINQVKEALPGLEADPSKQEEAMAEAVEARLDAAESEHTGAAGLTPNPEQTTVDGESIGGGLGGAAGSSGGTPSSGAGAAGAAGAAGRAEGEGRPGAAGGAGTAAGPASGPERYAAVDGRKYFTDEDEPVSRQTALRNARATMATGYAAGLATGSGIGAIATVLLGRIFRRS